MKDHKFVFVFESNCESSADVMCYQNSALFLKYNILDHKGNAKFLILCNHKKSGASLVCIIFPQITQKIPTKDNSLGRTDHWNSKLSANIQFGKNDHSASYQVSRVFTS